MAQKRLTVLGSVAVAGALLVMGGPTPAAEKELPDFTGVWTNDVEPGQSPRGFGRTPPNQPFTPEGRRRYDEYRKLFGARGRESRRVLRRTTACRR